MIHINKAFGNAPFTFLDVGAGNRSASKTKAIFPNCEYHGLDIVRDFNNDESDFAAMHSFYELDLTLLNLDIIPDSYFDFIRMAHVIEHLHNGDLVLPALIKKLKPNGYFYIEYPGEKSMHLPSMHGTLNFKDDPTHVRLYSVKEVSAIFENNNCTVIQSGTRRNKLFILLTPFRLLAGLLSTKKLNANIFWDILGFAEFVFAQKKAS
ncbi:methyltransferase domain-containing protein [Niabella hibiscisoli]|uniref:methyltransferase domain-containing protein n=1 Tax=Niabella hibiscisoli TaxID=1825928 RepID=UPI00293E85EC|nr:methyltransferase domain-containing protein [Niabella hibiscisoli]